VNPLFGSITGPLRGLVGRWQPPESWPDWAKRGVGVGPVLGAVVAAALLWFPTHSISESMTTGIVLFVVMAGIRAIDPSLRPLWEQLARVPRVARIVAGMAVPIWFSISQFGPSAAGKEVGTARQTLAITAILGYVLMHPDPEPEGQGAVD
jgi:hypothetical protein